MLSFPSNLSNTPIEVFEQMAPVRVISRGINHGSGGKGGHRGGDRLYFEIESLGESPMLASMMMTRFKSAPKGAQGGEPGRLATLLLNGKTIDPAKHWILKK